MIRKDITDKTIESSSYAFSSNESYAIPIRETAIIKAKCGKNFFINYDFSLTTNGLMT
tara:strand:- start:289 stop:462 length:174 start_codon:yes stop_codon:yes gene_type:complete